MIDQHASRAISDEGLALLRRLRVQYVNKPTLYRDLLTLSALALAASANGSEIAITDDRNGPSEMTTAEAAAQAGVSERAIRLAIAEHRLTATKRGGRWWIAAVDLARWCVERAA